MAVKILIQRTVPEAVENELKGYLKLMRTMTTNQEGYLYGETLKRVDRPGEFLVVSTWQDLDSWEKWFKGKERSEVQDRIDALIGVPTEYKVYSY